jgi:hypothetical protein
MVDPKKPHHTAEGFRNNYPTLPRGSFWKWQWERWRKGLPELPDGGHRFEVVRPVQIMHVNPEEAVKIHQDLGARYSVAMHWGTFLLSDEALDEPPHRLASARRAAGISGHQFFLMKHGETRRLASLMRRERRQPEAEAVADS